MRKVVTGEQVAQLYNRDPYALPVWRAPVYQTPAIVTIAVQLYRLISWLVRMIARHPVAAGILTVVAVIWLDLGWVVLIALAAAVLAMLVLWRWFWPVAFARWVSEECQPDLAQLVHESMENAKGVLAVHVPVETSAF